jgi:hypothetical protein
MAATPMPTGAKAVAAIAFAVVGLVIVSTYIPLMPDAAAVGPFREFTAAIGAIVGWRVMGPSVGKGYLEAAASGLKTVIVLVFFALLALGIYEMLGESTRMRYDGPLEAIIDIFARMAERAPPLVTFNVMLAMLLGGVIGGMLAENASRRWT